MLLVVVVVVVVVAVVVVAVIFRGYNTAVFISALISSPSVDNCQRRNRGLLTEGLI